jgi:hypothetical protein
MKNIKIDLQKIKEELNDNYVMVLDTETIGLSNRIIYNLGYKIFDLTNGKVVVKNDFVVQQFYDNKPLMMTAYYKDKKPLYTKLMKGKKAKKEKWGKIMQIVCNDIKKYQIENCFAYNSNFDIKSIQTTMELFPRNKNNILDYVEIKDIMKYIKPIVESKDFEEFAITNGNVSEVTGKPSKSAQSLYRYIKNDPTFVESHTALADCDIELDILLTALAFTNKL